ncbi:malonyl-CoA decarboxylase [Hesseltinella vesiculosa]|uniref:Malonyl-CoA decarboxylase n=1 Tax=Hesseltinella vesiculosa TaxID=101127 RepID=A0A1X2GHS8_9FUNG|nr:malonyl-CoA decarboxylase [Hesseltinella vesiculosa]
MEQFVQQHIQQAAGSSTLHTLDMLSLLDKKNQLVYLDSIGESVPMWLDQVQALPDHFLRFIQLRSKLLALARTYPTHPHLVTWTSLLSTRMAGALNVVQCQTLSAHTPSTLLEKIVQYETVHAVANNTDLERRLGPDRRVYALTHPDFPMEPLAFVHVALTEQSPTSVQSILQQPYPCTSTIPSFAICYSINTQSGLGGLKLAHHLINHVVHDLSSQFPSIHTFATLSPIPGFRRWFAERQEDRKSLDPSNPNAQPALLHLCANYLLLQRRSSGHALDPVAHFHLRNGASIQNLHGLADDSEKGMQESMGMMVNYQYAPLRLEHHQKRYREDGIIFADQSIAPDLHHSRLVRLDPAT